MKADTDQGVQKRSSYTHRNLQLSVRVMSLIYVARCTLNSMVYVGKHTPDDEHENLTLEKQLEKRKNQHLYDARHKKTPFSQALLHQGLANWKWDVVAECDSTEVDDLEDEWIDKFKVDGLDLLNVQHNRKRKRKKKKTSTFRQQASAQRTWESKGALGWMYLDGKLQPCKNRTTGEWFRSLTQAETQDKIGRASIKRSCETGYLAMNDCQYVYTDLDGNEQPTPGHEINSKSRFKRTYSAIKHLNSDKTFYSIDEAANVFSLNTKNVQAVCGGQYKSTGGHSFCYVNHQGEDDLRDKHLQFIEELTEKEKYCFAVYELDDVKYEHPQLFSSTEEIAQKLNIESRGHIPAVVRGDRSHVEGFRVTKYELHNKCPVLTETHKRPPKKVIRAVICLDDLEPYESPASAARYYGADSAQIRLCCKGILKTTRNDKGERLRFAYIDKNGNPKLTQTHLDAEKSLEWKGTGVYCPQFEMPFPSIAAFIREAKKRSIDLSHKRVSRHLEDPEVHLAGLHVFKLGLLNRT